MITHFRSILVLTFVTAISALSAADNTQVIQSELWQQYVKEKKAGKSTFLPDFSYAGYGRAERAISYPEANLKTFKVTDYGAVADDDQDDRQAIIKAVRAAEKAGGGIVFFPKGTYLVNSTLQNRGKINITSSNIILKGEGATEGGTIIKAIEPFGGGNPHDYRRLHLGDNVINVYSKPEQVSLSKKELLCNLSADTARGALSIKVDDTSKIKDGQYVMLYALNNKIFDRLASPYKINPKWTRITQNKAYIAEIHQIKEINGNTVTFHEPLQYETFKTEGWSLRPFTPIKSVGVEDICFMGRGFHRFYHHRSGYDDGGWSFIKFKGTVNSWIRRCSFINSSQAICITLSANTSVLNIILDGAQGHHAPRAVWYNYGALFAFIKDRANHEHGPSFSQGSVSTVALDWDMTPGQPIDLHGGRPYCTLFDNVKNGILYGSSGGLRDYPQHLRFLILWNFKHYNYVNENVTYDFWQENKPNRFVKPIIAGITGNNFGFKDGTLQIIEGMGKQVKPSSLYRAQLELRLGKLPKWLEQAQSEYDTLKNAKLPEFYRLGSKSPEKFLFIKEFNIDQMLKHLCSLSLQMFKSKQFTYTIDNTESTIKTDQVFLRNALYFLMNAIYRSANIKNGNTITTKTSADKIEFIIKSGKKNSDIDLKTIKDDVYYSDALIFAKAIGGKVTDSTDNSRLTFTLSIPNRK